MKFMKEENVLNAKSVILAFQTNLTSIDMFLWFMIKISLSMNGFDAKKILKIEENKNFNCTYSLEL